MELNSDNTTVFCETCVCGKSFNHPGRLKFHQRTCSRNKKRLAGALEKAKETWMSRKKRRLLDPDRTDGPSGEALHLFDVPSSVEGVETEDETMGGHDVVLRAQSAIENLEHSSVDPNPLSLAEGRPRRQNRQLPKRFRDILPVSLPFFSPAPLHPALPPSTPLDPSAIPPASLGPASLTSRIRQLFKTPKNVFGLSRQYDSGQPPSHDPEEQVDLHDLSDLPSATMTADASAYHRFGNIFNPYPNQNSFLLGDWHWNHGIQKSRESFSELLKIVGSPDFHPADVRHTKWAKIDTKLAKNNFDDRSDDNAEDDAEWMDEDAGWNKTPIHISVPFHSRAKKPGLQNYHVGDLYHRSFVSVIREKLSKPEDVRHFHYEPYMLFWKSSDTSDNIRVHGELYTSPAFLEAHRELQDSPGEPGCHLPWVVVAMMFASDATHLTSFGNKKLWPAYLYFGNESKYHRCKPTCHLCNHIAYFQALPDAFKDFVTENMGNKGDIKLIITHCRREVMHAQWTILLDDEFIEAYKHGIVIKCCDGITRRFYPRILTYSADYPEKVLLATIRDKGNCLCPRCLIPKSRVQNMGMKRDMQQRESLARIDDEVRRHKVDTAREIIYRKKFVINNQAVEALLREHSLVPTPNAFSRLLGPLGFNLFPIFVVDLMHEFELGVWRALFIHLLRILNSVDKALINELDSRFRQVPTFARDFEDLLQCAIPVFDGLLPEPHNSAILQLLFFCAHWHALAKLRMHTDDTLKIFDDITVRIGAEFRKFSKKTCPTFTTRELQRETRAHKRRSAKKRAAGGRPVPAAASASSLKADTPRLKNFNLHTYKYHSFGDYPNTIRKYGTCDLYSSEPSELEHRTPKGWFKRTDRRHFIKQMACIERRQARIRRIRARSGAGSSTQCEQCANTPQEHHHIGLSQNQHQHIGTFLRTNAGDPAVKDFLPKLKRHLLPRILSMLQVENLQDQTLLTDIQLPTDIQDCDPNSVLFLYDRMYEHNLLRINYTTYDVRRSQDAVNASTSHYNIMMLNKPANDNDSDNDYPFKYARVLGTYHVNVVYVGPVITRLCTMDGTRKSSIASTSPQSTRLKALVLLIHRQSYEAVMSYRPLPEDRYTVTAKECPVALMMHQTGGIIIFVDRDMFMRYHYGLGVGHVYAHCPSSTGAQQSAEETLLDEDVEASASDREASQMENEDRAAADSDSFSESGSEHSLDRYDDSDALAEDPEDDGDDGAMDEMYGSDYFEP
ncbi:hypothetical protein PILCRDRAFT_14341 [Piloderma croceum F 1598]|uniref:C2H2-type domain-containing protein n=1 Tax=Piloderma croceum (strain F 1598) TaxID=765440 RepID=A0A0C3F3F5_PILCF|nr:hypothetical protein PILCRDRAFT_14341 [Piloderma croceum F 1598]